jgi:phosphoserine/homoserine phosphotransferase
MKVLCLDLEGVLVPEIWIAVSESTGIPELRKTTRDVPVYEDLMAFRLKVLAERGLDLATIQRVIGNLDPLPGALEFLTWTRKHFQVVIVSDTFYEFAGALMPKLETPLLLCHRLQVEQGRITGYTLRQTDSKRHAVKAFRALNYQVIAAGDSFNDIPMLEEASHGFFYRAPPNVIAQYPQFRSARDYAELEGWLTDLLD